jgi:Histidine kinase-, DNA gyrase B-, and HSP90-like ATPase
MTRVSDMKVTSHVGRDLLASAAAFKTEAAAVWEYVVNGLQYVDRGTTPRVSVQVHPEDRAITISDNGQGMTDKGLQHFFTMHGENLERLSGRPGRGKFGTGKSAAFGIAKSLRVDTVRDGLRNVAELTRDMIESSSGKEIPVDWLTRNERVDSANGTTVFIEDVVLRQIRTAPIIEYVERHLQAFRAIAPEVAVNDHVCAYREPEIEAEHRFDPSPEQAQVLGFVSLLVKVARAPLPDAEQGILITAGSGNLVAVEKAGTENKEFGPYLFGEIDVPALENPSIPIAPYDSSRSLQLNVEHPVASVLVGFIGSKLEQVRTDLVRRAKDARKTEQARRLEMQAQKIAEMLNNDFNSIRDRLNNIKTVAAKAGSAGARFGSAQSGDQNPDSWVSGTSERGRVERTEKSTNPGSGRGRNAPDIGVAGEPDADGKDPIDPEGTSDGTRRRPRGGFQVVYRNLGRSEYRSRYEERSLSILINLDHPVLSAAMADGNVEDPAVRRLSYEIAFSEYAMALGYELLKNDPNMPADDLLYEVRSSLNRVALSAAPLYR